MNHGYINNGEYTVSDGSQDPANGMVFSDDESTKNVSWASVRHWKIPFKRNFGITLGELIKSTKGRKYLRRLAEWDELYDESRANIECALAEYDRLKVAHTIPMPVLERNTFVSGTAIV